MSLYKQKNSLNRALLSLSHLNYYSAQSRTISEAPDLTGLPNCPWIKIPNISANFFSFQNLLYFSCHKSHHTCNTGPRCRTVMSPLSLPVPISYNHTLIRIRGCAGTVVAQGHVLKWIVIVRNLSEMIRRLLI